LFGTFHEAGNSIFDSFRTAEKLLLRSKVLLIENTDTTSPSPITQDDVNRGAPIWESLLSSDKWKVFVEYATKYKMAGYLALPGNEILLNLHHDYISRFCTLHSKDTLFIMDYQIQVLAKRNGLDILPLDKIAGYDHSKINITDSISKTDTATINEMISIMSNILNAKKDQEPCWVLKEYIQARTSYLFNTKAIDPPFEMTDRNKKWMTTIIGLLNNQSCFIAVGFNHLRYREGLVRLLRQEGFTLTPVSMK
jgi:hypothetical protein